MMSRAFKVFLLMILGFGSLWAYQFRTRDLRAWLERGEPALGSMDALPVLRSPVNRVLDPRKDSRALATIYFQEPFQEAEVLEEEVLSDLPTAPAANLPAAQPRRSVPEEEPPEVIILREESPREPPRTRDPKTSTPDAGKKEKAKAKEKPAEKVPEKKVERPKVERAKSTRPDPHAMPADGSRPAGEPVQGLAGDPARPLAPTHLAPALAHPAPGAAPVSEVAKVETAPSPAKRRSITHVVKEKETLASLARQYYQSDTGRWREIFAANQARLPDPDALSPGMVIEIPDAVPAENPGKDPRKPSAQAAKPKQQPKPATRSG